nr:2-oxoacid:acceptor oxidoreductase subunit alpha [Nocardioides marmoriginsengisoli]
MTTTKPEGHTSRVVIRFAGDSGDGMQLVGDRFSAQSAAFGNDLATLPNFPAEIRAPQGTVPGVSSFQIHFADYDILTPGDRPDVLVAMNPAALMANLGDVEKGSTIVANSDEFTTRNLAKVGYDDNPLTDGSLESYVVHSVAMTTITRAALADTGLSKKDADRCRNLFALGLLSWMYSRPIESTEKFLRSKFASKPDIADANVLALHTGWNYGETTESIAAELAVGPATLPTGQYRQVNGNAALAYGLATAGYLSQRSVVLGAYPITPASDILHNLSLLKDLGVVTLQVEDEIAGVCTALGASYGGALGVTATSGPGMALKAEAIGLGVMTELPLVVVDVQRGGPSTGLPTKTEQADLLMAIHGRNGESPVPVLAPSSPADCFDIAIEAATIALRYRTPVIILSDGAVANGSEPWRVPSVADLPSIEVNLAAAPNALDGSGKHWPYVRDPETLARDWAIPGTAGLEHRIGGLEKSADTGEISYDPTNHDTMVRLRQAKVDGVLVPDLEVDDPSGQAEILILGWGSTFGPIGAGVRRARTQGVQVARAHLRHLNPLPRNLDAIVGAYSHVVVAEMNLGQLAKILRARTLSSIETLSKVTGQPFLAEEIEKYIIEFSASQEQA